MEITLTRRTRQLVAGIRANRPAADAATDAGFDVDELLHSLIRGWAADSGADRDLYQHVSAAIAAARGATVDPTADPSDVWRAFVREQAIEGALRPNDRQRRPERHVRVLCPDHTRAAR